MKIPRNAENLVVLSASQETNSWDLIEPDMENTRAVIKFIDEVDFFYHQFDILEYFKRVQYKTLN